QARLLEPEHRAGRDDPAQEIAAIRATEALQTFVGHGSLYSQVCAACRSAAMAMVWPSAVWSGPSAATVSSTVLLAKKTWSCVAAWPSKQLPPSSRNLPLGSRSGRARAHAPAVGATVAWPWISVAAAAKMSNSLASVDVVGSAASGTRPAYDATPRANAPW